MAFVPPSPHASDKSPPKHRSQGAALIAVVRTFLIVIERDPTVLIVIHNHPSGDPSPSRADIDLTRAIAAAGKPLNIAVHDHLIIGANGHVSLRAQGLL